MNHVPSKSRSWIWIALIIPLMFACDWLDDPKPVSKIRVEDTHVSTWIVFDNGWTGQLGPRTPPNPNDGSLCNATGPDAAQKKFGKCTSYVAHDVFRPGVMFQLGLLYEPDENDPTQLIPRDHLDHVILTIEPPNQAEYEVELREEADDTGADGNFFDWLDILPMKGKDTNQECVIDAKHGYMLFKNSHAQTLCDPTADWANQCLRNRSLHASFQANKGVITYWTNPNTRYSMATARLNVDGHTHITYDFDLNDVVSVDVWRDGCWQDRHDHVTNVLIKYTSDPFHGGYHDPPMDGGHIGR